MIPGGPNNEQRPHLPAVKWPRSEIGLAAQETKIQGKIGDTEREKKKEWVLEETVTD